MEENYETNKDGRKELLEKKIGQLEKFLKVYKVIIIVSLIIFISVGGVFMRYFEIINGLNFNTSIFFIPIVLLILLHIWILNRFINVITYILKKY